MGNHPLGVRIIYLRCIGHQVPSIKRPFPSLPSPRTGIVGNRRHKCSAFLLGRCDGLVALLLYNLDIAPPAIARVLRQPSFPSRLSRIRLLACGYLELAAGHTCARLLDQYAIGSAAWTASSEASSPGTSIRASNALCGMYASAARQRPESVGACGDARDRGGLELRNQRRPRISATVATHRP
jgi:hypothetical protein